MAKPIDELRQVRLEKLDEIRKLGVDPYPSVSNRKQTVLEALKMEGKGVYVSGRIMAMRGHGGIQFFDLRDESGKIQLVFKKDSLSPISYSLLLLLDIGDFIEASGDIFKTKAGEISVSVKNFRLLTKSIRPLPSAWHGLKKVEDRYRQRYVDLIMNPEVKKVFETRAKLVQLLRQYLDAQGFIELTTPALQPIYGGATARPFITHHNALNIDLYLRIADELYLKRLIVGGFEKVYEVCTDFRNEGIDRWHNPEFTQVEFYWAYANYEDLMKLTEEMLSWIVKEIKGSYEIEYEGAKINFKAPWEKLVFRDAILANTGVDIDKFADLRSLLEEVKKGGIKLEAKDTHDLSSVYDSLYKQEVRPKITDPTFIIDHPYIMRPLAKRKAGNPDRVESLQPVAAGTELLNAYSELNDPVDQKNRWLEDMKRAKGGAEEFQVVDDDYIQALEYGMPPTAGWGMGTERFTAILTDQHSLKDVILFPTLRPEGGSEGAGAKDEKENRTKEKFILSQKPEEIFFIDPEVKNRFPGMKVGAAVIEGVKIHKGSKELEKFKEEVLKKLSEIRIGDIDSLPTIKAYREIFRDFGVDWHSRRPSVDALLRRVSQGKGLYNVNTLVDAYNLAVLDSKIALGAFDYQKISFPTVLRLVRAGEQIVLLGEAKPTEISEGEMVYADQVRILTLDLNYRDCDYAKVTTGTKNVILYADGCQGIASEEVTAGLEKGVELITRFCGGKVVKKFITE